MADGRKNNGGHSTKGFAGRKPKSDEIAKIEMMDSIGDASEAWRNLWDLVKKKDLKAIQFWLDHRFGKAKTKADITTNDEPIDGFPYQKLPPALVLQIADALQTSEEEEAANKKE